jgi:hypothetical protein
MKKKENHSLPELLCMWLFILKSDEKKEIIHYLSFMYVTFHPQIR